jgi:competence protein ComEC
VAAFLLAYALMTGSAPQRSQQPSWCVVRGEIILRKRINRANALAFAWLIVLGVNPTDPFKVECQLSFLSVFVSAQRVTG